MYGENVKNTVEEEIFKTREFRKIAATGGSRQEKLANLGLEESLCPLLYSGNIRVQEFFTNLQIFTKFAKFSCTRKFPVLQYLEIVGGICK